MDKPDFSKICESDENSRIRMSPNLKLVMYIISKKYQIKNISEESITYLNYQEDELNFEVEFFFINDDLIAIPLAGKQFYAIIRVKDGSCLCKISRENKQFIFDNDCMDD